MAWGKIQAVTLPKKKASKIKIDLMPTTMPDFDKS